MYQIIIVTANITILDLVSADMSQTRRLNETILTHNSSARLHGPLVNAFFYTANTEIVALMAILLPPSYYKNKCV